MNIITGYSKKTSPEEIVQDLKKQFGDFDCQLVLYFGSSLFDQQDLSHAMQKGFGPAEVLGCSTAGEIVSGRMLKESVVAMGFDATAIQDVKIEVLESISGTPDVTSIFKSFEQHFGTPVREMDFSKYVGIILVDGLRGAEERIMDQIGDLTQITFIGGSAGDDLKFEKTHVCANGKAYTDAAVLALLRPGIEFDVIKTQSFTTLDKRLTVTKANEAAREAVEFDHRPAAQAYADAVGVPVTEADTHFMKHPIGLMVDEEPYVRSPQQIKDGSVVFYCNVLEGMELSLLESTDIVADTWKAIEDKKNELGDLSGIVNFHCILRTLDLEANGRTEEYGRLFANIPTVGFSTYGEEYIGHINQTSTMLVFR